MGKHRAARVEQTPPLGDPLPETPPLPDTPSPCSLACPVEDVSTPHPTSNEVDWLLVVCLIPLVFACVCVTPTREQLEHRIHYSYAVVASDAAYLLEGIQACATFLVHHVPVESRSLLESISELTFKVLWACPRCTSESDSLVCTCY